MSDFLTALGLVFVIEGLLYAMFPAGMIRMLEDVRNMNPASLRIVGLVAAMIGVVIVWLIRG